MREDGASSLAGSDDEHERAIAPQTTQSHRKAYVENAYLSGKQNREGLPFRWASRPTAPTQRHGKKTCGKCASFSIQHDQHQPKIKLNAAVRRYCSLGKWMDGRVQRERLELKLTILYGKVSLTRVYPTRPIINISRFDSQ